MCYLLLSPFLTCHILYYFLNAMRSARTGLIFTRIQEGAQPGGLTPPGQTEQGIPYHVPSCWILVGGSWGRELSCGSGVRGGGHGRQLSGLCGLCCVLSLSVSLLLLFLLFAILLNCPYPNPPVSASFFPFSSAPQRGEGRLCGAFVAGGSQTRTLNLAPKHGAGITAGLSIGC